MSGSHEKLPWLFWAQLFLAAVILVLYLLAPSSKKHGEDDGLAVSESSKQALKPIGEVAIASADGSSASGSERTGKEIVEKTCQSCHANGVANAPKLDESAKAAWESRLGNGMAGLIKVAKEGKGAMPAMGTDPTLTDAELKNSIVYMLEKAGVEVPADSGDSAEEAPAAIASTAGSSERTGKEIVEKSCQSCHAHGVANAPKLDDSAKAAWESRLGNGIAGLIKVAKEGKGAMPPMGTDPTLSDAELKNAIVYMLGKAGVDVPAEGADSAKEAPVSASNEESSAPPEQPAEPSAPKSPVAPAEEAEVAAVSAPEPVEQPKPEKSSEPAAPKQAEEVEVTAPTAPDQLAAVVEKAAAPSAPDQPANTEVAATTATAAGSSQKSTIDGKKLYQSSCFSCHATGVAGSPKVEDKEAWAPRIAGGIEALYEGAIKGKGVMPAKGGNMSLSDDEVKAAVDYMVSQSQ